MVKIGFISTVDAPWGGSEELWSQSAALLRARGHAIGANVGVVSEPMRQIQALAQAGCQITSRPRLRRPQRLNAYLRFRWLDQFQPEHVVLSLAAHQHGADWMRECAQRGIPYSLIVQSGDESYFHTDGNTDLLMAGYEQAKGCYFVSQGNVDFVRAQLATPLAHAQVVRNPFNVSYDAALPWPDDKEGYKLACVARLEPLSKGQDILFDVLRADKWRQRPLRVTLFGNGITRQTLIRLKDMYRLENVTFGGFVSNVEEIWAAHHALVLPSRFEGLPLAIVEAMLCGRPCIVTDVSGNAEIPQDNISGFIAAAPRRDALDEAMERAWQRRAEWRQMGQAAARRVREMVPSDPAGLFADELSQVVSRS